MSDNKLSNFNIFSKIKNSNDYFIVNLLSGNADILSEEQALQFSQGTYNAQELLDKGYLINPEKEQEIFRKIYLDFIENRDKEEIQIFFVPTYACNFSCSYCYQSDYTTKKIPISVEVIDSFFSYILKTFAGKKFYITLFGGEPLLVGEKYRSVIEYFFAKIKQFNIDLAIVTNGYNLVEYIDLFHTVKIREIQVTLDGTRTTHDSRRFTGKKMPTFDKIVRGIDALLEHKINVNLRMVVDKENINNLPELADFAIGKGWTSHPNFKTQLGRNYELHHSYEKCESLYSRIELYEKIYELVKQFPQILEFYKPSFSIAKFLFENGDLPEPLFDACPACKTEWAFDYTGKIFSCTATVGNTKDELGTFYPNINLNENKIDSWINRDILSIQKCKTCSLSLACGGGCGSIAQNQQGDIHAPDCRPIKELLELGISLYHE